MRTFFKYLFVTVMAFGLTSSLHALTSVTITAPSSAEVNATYFVSVSGQDDLDSITDLTVTRNGLYWKSASYDPWDSPRTDISVSGNVTAPSSPGSDSYYATLDTDNTSVTDSDSVSIVDTTAPSVPTGLADSSITETSFTLSWTASTDNVGVTAYEVRRDTTSLGTTASTSMNITNLSASTSYSMTVRARDAAGNWSNWSAARDVTTDDNSAPSIPTGLSYSNLTEISFTLSWTASTDNVGVTAYEVMRDTTSLGTTASTSMNITGLTGCTTYSMKVRARDAAGNWSNWSSVLNVTTPDTCAPSPPTGLAASSVGMTSFTLSWTASTDNVGVTAYEVRRDTTSLGTTASTSMNITGLTPNTTYSMTVRARDAAGNWSAWSAALNVTTTVDTEAPSIPTGLSYSNLTEISFTLSWTASTDNVGVTAYEVRRDTTSLGTTTATSMNITGLTPNTTYSMTVRARDAAGNWSAWSAALNVTTAADTQAPSAPTNLSSPAKTDTTVDLSWTASTDNVGVTSYDVFTDGNFAINVTGTTATVTGLTASTSYAFTVKAKDAAGNESVASSALNVTTSAASSASFPVSGLISHWKLDETSGTRVDSHGSNDLTDHNTVGSGVAVLGNGATFVAANSEYLDVTTHDLHHGDIDFTWAFWIYQEVVPQEEVFSVGSNSSTRELVVEKNYGGEIRLILNDTGSNFHSFSSTTEVAVQDWSFVVIWHDSVNNEFGIQIDGGTPELLSHSTGVLSSTGPFRLGVDENLDYGNIRLDSVSRWNRVLTSQERTDLYNSGNGLEYAPVGLSKTDLVAWYDFDDATDSHGSYDLTEVGTPSYTGGYGIASESLSEQWSQASLDNNWGNVDQDTTYVCRFRGYGSFADGDRVFVSNSWRHSIRHRTGGLRGELFDVNVTTSTVAANGSWYLVVATYDSAAGEMAVSVNDANLTTVTGTASLSGGSVYLGGTSTTQSDVEIDYFGFFNRKLTAAEITWLHNSGSTRTYAELGSTADTEAPSVPGGLSGSSITQTSFTLSWTASTDNVGVTAYEVRRDTTSLGTTASTSMNITGLTASTTYAMTVRARDAAGNWSAWSSATNVTTSAASDTEAPTVPTGLSSSNLADTSFTLSWTASTDNVGVTAYEVMRDTTSLGTTASTSMNITGLTASTTYAMKVRARDAAGNWSAWSSATNVTTSAASDTEAPTVPTGLASSNLADTSFTLSWTASTDNVGVTAYEVMRDTTSLGTTASTSMNITGLTASTTYAMKVRARDAAGNWSNWSSVLNVTTNAASSAFAYPSVVFDGTNDYLTRGSDLTGNADGKKGILSFWIKFPNDNDNDAILSSSDGYFRIEWSWTGVIEISGRQTSGSDALRINTTTSYDHMDGWIHVLASWDLATGSTHLYVSDVDDKTVVTAANVNIDYTRADYVIGANSSFGNKLEAKLSEFYLNTSEYLDFSVESNRRKFISADKIPVDLGSDGSTPTGTQPIVYLHNDVPDWETNLGSGGNFTENGALVDGGADVPLATSSNAYIKDLVAWYDFDDATDSHGTYDLTPLGTPTYTGGYGIASNSSNAHWTQTSVDNAWGNADHDTTFVCRFRGYGSFVNGHYVFLGNGWRHSIRHRSDGLRAEVFDTWINSGTTAVNGSWYLVVATYDASTGEMAVSVNDSAPVTVTATPTLMTGDFYLGGNNDARDVEIDYFGCFNRKLTAAEITWLYNSGGTRTYAEVLAEGASDTEAPTAPTNLSSPAKTTTTVDLSWTASTDNVGVTSYDVYKGGVLEMNVSGTTATVTGLTASTSYAFSVKAKDAAGNVSTASNTLNVTTDSTGPDAPTGLTLDFKTNTRVDLSWTASAGAVSYVVYKDGNAVAGVDVTYNGTSATVTGLTASTSYNFTVRAKDASQVESADSNTVQVTTNATADSDGDGMDDSFEQQIVNADPGITSVDQVHPEADYDSDNITNMEEFLLGLDPTAVNTSNDNGTINLQVMPLQ